MLAIADRHCFPQSTVDVRLDPLAVASHELPIGLAVQGVSVKFEMLAIILFEKTG